MIKKKAASRTRLLLRQFEDTFSNAKTFRLKNYTYICSKLGFSYEESPNLLQISKTRKF